MSTAVAWQLESDYGRDDFRNIDPLPLQRTRSPNVSLRRQRSVEAMRATAEPEPESEERWRYVDAAGKQQGPHRLELLREWHAAGRLPKGLSAWRDSDDQPTPATELFGDDDEYDRLEAEVAACIQKQEQEAAAAQEQQLQCDAAAGADAGADAEAEDEEYMFLGDLFEEYTLVPAPKVVLREWLGSQDLGALEALASLDGAELTAMIATAVVQRQHADDLAALEATVAATKEEADVSTHAPSQHDFTPRRHR